MECIRMLFRGTDDKVRKTPAEERMRIVSWNVNGLKKLKPVDKLLERLDADIVCFQETRVSSEWDPELESLAFVKGYHSFFSVCKQKRGYSGVATFCKKGVWTPYDACEGFEYRIGGASLSADASGAYGACSLRGCPCEVGGCSAESMTMIEDEGRCVITDHKHFMLINVYIPAVSVEGRMTFKLQFLHALQAKMEALRSNGRHVIVVGDYNICPSLQDVAEPVPPSMQAEWEQRPSRTWLRNILDPRGLKFVDSFRELHPGTRDAYTCWSEATRGRENNYGVRIDLIVMDRDLFVREARGAAVHADMIGSDHCPVSVTLDMQEGLSSVVRSPPPFCMSNKQRFALRQKTLKDVMQTSRSFGNVQRNALDVVPTDNAQMQKPVRSEHKSSCLRQPPNFKSRRRKPAGGQATISAFFGSKQRISKDSGSSAEVLDAVCESPAPVGIVDRCNTTLQHTVHPARDVVDTKEISKRIKSAAAWRKLLSGPPPPPLCKHGLRCVLKSVGKPGENKGRTFFSCPYPAGVGKNADCHFFKWAPFKAGMATLPK